MRRKSRYGKQKGKCVDADVTVYHFADSTPGQFSGLRGRKSEKANNKELQTMATAEDDVSWFDKDLDDFDVTVDKCTEDGMDGNGGETCSVKKSSRRRQKIMRDETGEVYPIDLWFQLSRFIFPENVGTFALLCKGTNTVVHSVHFWKNLYLRHYIEDGNIPDDLRLNSLDCIHGLRARTIKMLNFVYPFLVKRNETSVPFENEPHCLVGQRCLLTWHKKVKNVWKFYFKFRKGEVDLSSNERQSLKSRHFEKWHQDLFYNPDDNSSILEVTCPGYVSLPVVMGLILNGVVLNVSVASMRYHRLKLLMDTSYRMTNAKNQMSMFEVNIDPVLEVRVFPWWHPSFTETQSILLINES